MFNGCKDDISLILQDKNCKGDVKQGWIHDFTGILRR